MTARMSYVDALKAFLAATSGRLEQAVSDLQHAQTAYRKAAASGASAAVDEAARQLKEKCREVRLLTLACRELRESIARLEAHAAPVELPAVCAGDCKENAPWLVAKPAGRPLDEMLRAGCTAPKRLENNGENKSYG